MVPGATAHLQKMLDDGVTAFAVYILECVAVTGHAGAKQAAQAAACCQFLTAVSDCELVEGLPFVADAQAQDAVLHALRILGATEPEVALHGLRLLERLYKLESERLAAKGLGALRVVLQFIPKGASRMPGIREVRVLACSFSC